MKYVETKWDMDWFVNKKSVERGYWRSSQNQTLFLRKFASSNRIEFPRDWGKVTNKMIIDAGGCRIIEQYGSVRVALQELFRGRKSNLSITHLFRYSLERGLVS